MLMSWFHYSMFVHPQLYQPLQIPCSMCYNPHGIIWERRMGYEKWEKTATHSLSNVRRSGRNGLHNSCSHCTRSHLRSLPWWPIPYETFVDTARAAAWPDFGNIWGVPFIKTIKKFIVWIDGSHLQRTDPALRSPLFKEDAECSGNFLT